MRDHLGDEGKFADWDRSFSADRFAYNFKMIIVMKDGEGDAEARNKVYDLKDQVALRLKREEFFVDKRACFVVSQASLERRELFALAGRFTSALVASSAESGLATKREYAAQGITILVWRSAAEDKNSHLAQRNAAGGGGGGRWVRVAEWTSKAKD